MAQAGLFDGRTGIFEDDDYFAIMGKKEAVLAYGENPWQSPAFRCVTDANDPLGLSHFEVVSGRSPSFINTRDGDRLLRSIRTGMAAFDLNFSEAPYMAFAVKHGNACG